MPESLLAPTKPPKFQWFALLQYFGKVQRRAGCSGSMAAWSLLVFPKCGQRIGTIQIQIQKQGEIQLVSFPNEKGGQRRPHGGLRRIGRWADCRAGPRETID